MRLKKILILGTCWILCGKAAAGQARLADSLNHLLSIGASDSQRVEWLYQLGQEVEPADPEQAKAYYVQAFELSKRGKIGIGVVKFYLNYTAALNMQARFDSSLALNLESIQAARTLGDSIQVAKCLQNTGVSYFYLEDYESCIDYFLQAIPAFEQGKDPLRLSILYSNLGSVYRETDALEKALHYHQLALKGNQETENIKEMGRSLSNLGIVYTDLARLVQADSCLREALRLGEQNDDVYLVQNASLNMTNLRLHQGLYAEVIPYAKAALRGSEAVGDSLGWVIAHRALGLAAFHQQAWQAAIAHADSALPVALRLAFKEQTAKIYSLLADAHLGAGRWQDYQRYQRLADSMERAWQAQNWQKRVQALDKKFETKQKNQAIRLLQQDQAIKSFWITGLAIGLVLVLLISWLWYRGYKQRLLIQKKQLEALEQERKWLASQSLLQGQDEERKRLAKDLHDGLGGLLSGVKLQLGAMQGNIILSAEQGQTFESALAKLDESIREMRRVAQNMMPEALMNLGIQQAIADYAEQVEGTSGLRVNRELHGLDKRLTNAQEIAIYRIIQELLNNVVKHARAKNVLLQVIQNDQQVSITLEDDGLGFDASHWQQQPGVGLKSVWSRVTFLGGQMDVSSSAEQGTSIHIEFSI